MDIKAGLVDAALAHVPFDGWSDATFQAAVADAGVDMALARVICPRGAVDLAVAFHRQGDRAMVAALTGDSLSNLRFRDRVARAVQMRLELVGDKELVRRGTTLFALPQYAPDGARLIWETCDAIWNALGDGSEDYNWYTKRATLSAVYSSTVLYWLGDTSDGDQDTWDFLDRRIENVMSFEKLKAQMKGNKALSGVFSLLETIKKPAPMGDLPGRWAKE